MSIRRAGEQRIQKGLWWDRALTLVEGCTPVGPGCANCWAAAQTRLRAGQHNPKIRRRYAGLTIGNTFNGLVRLHPEALTAAARIRQAQVFAVWNDLFHESVPDRFITGALTAMVTRMPRHLFLVLTKRAARMAEYFETTGRHLHLTNVWLGVTVENQDAGYARIPPLLLCPAPVRFVSCEPMLGPGVLDYKWLSRLDWVIVGCESGPRRRACPGNWIVEHVVRQCESVHVPVFVKQVDAYGRVSRDPDEWPPALRRREFPAC